MPPPPVPPREAALSPISCASKAPRAQLLRARAGQQYKDYNSTGWSPYLADDPNQVGHRGVPIVVPAETINNNHAFPTQKRLAAPIEDITAFPALPPKMLLSKIEQKPNSNQIYSHPSGGSNMAGSGEDHVTRATPAQRQQTGGNATPKLKRNEKPFGTERRSIKKNNRVTTPHGTVEKVIGAISPANLAALKYLGDLAHVPTPTRPASRQEAASNLHTVKATFENFNDIVKASRPGESPAFQFDVDVAALRVPTKTLASDTLLAARGTIGATPHQYFQSAQGISIAQHNTASQFTTQQDIANSNVATHQVSPPHSPLPLRSPPPQAGFVSPPYANVASRRPADFSTGPPFSPDQASQYANMGFGYANAGDAMTDKKSSRPNAPTSQQEPAGNPTQHQQTVEASQGYNPQAWGQPGFQSIGGFPQIVLAEGGYLQQDAESNPRSFESAQRFQPNLSQLENFGENQASFVSNSPSESSFMMQMPGAFEPYRSHRNFDALPLPDLAAGETISETTLAHEDHLVSIPPGFEQHFAAIGMPAGQNLQKPTQVVPAFRSSQDYAGTHQITQEAQGLDPKTVGSGVSQPRELTAHALKISHGQDTRSGVVDQPLIQPPPGFEENRASFSAAEAQNDSKTTIRPPPGFEPRYQDFIVPPPKESVTTQSRLGISAPLQDITNSASNRTSELFDKSEAEPLYSEHTSQTTAHRRSINTSASSNPIPDLLPSINSLSEALAQSEIQGSAPIDEQGVSGFNALSQAMGTRTFEAQQQHAAAYFDHNGSYVGDIEIADEYEQYSQEVPAHLEERFRNLVGGVIENVGFTKEDGLAMIAEARGQTRAIYPPRIIGGEHHASRHKSPRRPSAGETIPSQNPNRPSQTPLRHTQPQIKAPVDLPQVPGLIWKPSPYGNARPARAGDESVTDHLNRLLMVAAMDGYMPAHLTLFTDTSQAAFEKANPEYRCIMRSDHAYSKPYANWVRKNETKVEPPIAPPGLINWMNMPGSATWAATVDPRSLPVAYMAQDSEYGGSQASEKTDTPVEPAQPALPVPKISPISRPVAQNSQESKIKDTKPASIVPVSEENEETSTEKEAMVQKAIELSLKESLPKVSTPGEDEELGPESLGPAPKETLRALSRQSNMFQQSKLSAEAPPFQSPAFENVVPFTAGGSNGRSQTLKPSQVLNTTVASATLRSISGASASSKAANVQQMGPQPAPTQYGRDTITKGSLASPTLTGRAMAFIADVPASVSTTAIRNVLNRYGKAINIEVNRVKKSAVAQFDTLAAFQAAVTANPHKIGNAFIRVQSRRPDAATSPATKLGLRAPIKESEDQEPLRTTQSLQPASKPLDRPVAKQQPKVAWPNAPWVVPKAPGTAAASKETVKQAPPSVPISQSKQVPKQVVKLPSRAPKPGTREPSADDEEAKPSVLLEPPKTPPKYRERFIPATPTSANTQRLLDFHSVGDQDRNLLALPDLGEVLENPPIVKKSARTSRRAVEKAAKRAKALLAKEARAEVAGSRLGMGKGVLEQIGALSDLETDASITDSETSKKIKKSAGPKKVVVKGIEVIPGVDINDNHGKDVHVDRSNIREKFVISRGQLKEVDLEKKRRKDEETVAMQQRAHKARAAEMKSRGKATSSLTDDWEDEEDRIAAAETAAQMQSRRGSSSGSVAAGPPVLMALGADFDGWRTTISRPTSSLAAESRCGSSQERPDTAMSMQSDFSMASSALPMPFPSASLPSAQDVPQFVEPAYVPPPLNRHIIAPAKPLSEIIATEAALRGGRLEDKSTDFAKPTPTSSWAQLAAGGKSSGSTSADTSRRGSSEVIELRGRSTSSVGGRNLMSRFTKAPGAVQSIKYDTNADNKRTVYILGVPQSTTLADISDSVSSGGYGAIYKIEFGVDADTGLRLAGILFRDAGEVVPGIHGTAWGAIGYYTALKNACDADYLKEYPLWPWPHDAPISVYLQEYPEEPLMLRMHHDSDAIKKGRQPLVTRHLCLVNKGKLHHDWHEEEMIAFCHASGVKAGNVQACCVHNFGNATLVFGSVEDAVMMRGKFLDKFKESKGMTVTYSTCPGEQQGPMQYKRDNVYLRHLESMGWDVGQEIEEGQYKEKKRRNSKWVAPTA